MKKAFQQHFNVDLQTVDLASKGCNWGETEFQGTLHGKLICTGNTLYFTIDGKRAFEIPLGDVSRAVIQNTVASKNDVSIEFGQDDTTDEHEILSEIRLNFPSEKENDKTMAQVQITLLFLAGITSNVLINVELS